MYGAHISTSFTRLATKRKEGQRQRERKGQKEINRFMYAINKYEEWDWDHDEEMMMFFIEICKYCSHIKCICMVGSMCFICLHIQFVVYLCLYLVNDTYSASTSCLHNDRTNRRPKRSTLIEITAFQANLSINSIFSAHEIKQRHVRFASTTTFRPINQVSLPNTT